MHRELDSRFIALMRPFYVALAALAIAACSADAESSAVPPARDAGGAPLDAASRVTSVAPIPELCEGLEQRGEPVPEIELGGNAPPPLGGTVLPGTYDLAELNVYAGPRESDGGTEQRADRPTGKSARITLLVGQFEMRRIEARGPEGALGPDRALGFLYRTDLTDVFLTAVCPTTAPPVALSFTAVGSGLALNTDATHRELYIRRE